MRVKNMSTEDIELRLLTITAEIAEVKAQIGRAKSAVMETGKYADSEWFHRASKALRLKGRLHQELQLEFGKRRKEQRAAYNARVEQAFISVAKKNLDAQTFRLLWEEALAHVS